MPQSLCQLYAHLIFSTKNHEPFLNASVRWQRGYGMFSVSPTHRERVEAYVRNQEEHHREKSFKEEYREFLERYGIEYDERYVWD